MTILDPVPGRATSELTRRDVVRALLAVPPDEALTVLPGMRRDLVAAENPLSVPFWEGAERVLRTVATGHATVGEVRRWAQATGSEPIDLFPAQGFVWPDEDERGPVAAEMHALLVSHLEGLVAAGVVEPDLLLADDPTAWSGYEQAQLTWLHAELPDGREPLWAVVDEHDQEFLAECDADDAEARAALAALLADLPAPPRPDAELDVAVARVRAGLADGGWPWTLVAAAGGVPLDGGRGDDQPDDDTELWLTLAAGAVTPQDEPPHDLDADAAAAWTTLAHPEWLAAVVALVRGGPGTAGDPHALAAAVEAAVDGEDGIEDDTVLTAGFGPAVTVWTALGALDGGGRLTALGWWGLPASLARAWTPASGREARASGQ